MASADYTVIDKLLIPDYTKWNIKFAVNEMAIVFSENSRYADEIKLRYRVYKYPNILGTLRNIGKLSDLII